MNSERVAAYLEGRTTCAGAVITVRSAVTTVTATAEVLLSARYIRYRYEDIQMEYRQVSPTIL